MEIISKSMSSIASSLAKSFASNVIEKWTRRRAENFFEAFQNEIMEKRQIGDDFVHIEQEIEKIISTEIGSEILFDAYRRVSLSKSKHIGPKIIGLLTAEICLEKRVANEFEEMIFSFAENLNDIEMINSVKVLNGWLDEIENYKIKPSLARNSSVYIQNDNLIYILERHELSGNNNSLDIDLNIDNLDGLFCVGMNKFKNLGFLKERISQSIYNDDREHDQYSHDQSHQFTTKTLSFPLKYRRILVLVSLMSRGYEI
ncbi:hypothetical protein [Aliivibrio fischeri]|uniref:hypothetical protein n=1 Tax=Aliivibrio fischeri TaxID=668 RepID=UPI0012DA7A85|nr:hypothetical protein [Aliivibrio fischeri]MUJ26327.1 hypothetical protein [Aliivibrio fischeri]